MVWALKLLLSPPQVETFFKKGFRGASLATAIFAAMLCPKSPKAGEFHELYRGTRAMAMGNAFVGLADDEQAVFINPAGMAGNKDYRFHYVVADLTLSTDTVKTVEESASALKNISSDTLNVLMGKNIFAQGQLTPTLMGPNFGLAYIADGQFGFFSQNRALPRITFAYQTTTGFQLAYGNSIGRRRSKKRGEFRYGFAPKILYRRGGYRPIPLATLMNLTKSTAGDLIKNYGVGYGLDLGTQYIRPISPRVTLSAGISWTDIGDTNFGDGPDPIRNNLQAGIAMQYKMNAFRINVTADHKHFLDRTDWRKKNHVGFEFGMPIFSLYAGLNQVFFTYGAGFNFWFLNLMIASYAEEHGSYVYQNPDRRWMGRLAFKFDF